MADYSVAFKNRPRPGRLRSFQLILTAGAIGIVLLGTAFAESEPQATVVVRPLGEGSSTVSSGLPTLLEEIRLATDEFRKGKRPQKPGESRGDTQKKPGTSIMRGTEDRPLSAACREEQEQLVKEFKALLRELHTEYESLQKRHEQLANDFTKLTLYSKGLRQRHDRLDSSLQVMSHQNRNLDKKYEELVNNHRALQKKYDRVMELYSRIRRNGIRTESPVERPRITRRSPPRAPENNNDFGKDSTSLILRELVNRTRFPPDFTN